MRFSLLAIWLLTTFECAAFAEANPAYGDHRALQTGSIGDSPQFSKIEKAESDAIIAWERSFGSYVLNGDSQSKVSSSSVNMKAAAGAGISISKKALVTVSLQATIANDFDIEQKRTAPNQSLDTGRYEHEILGMFIYGDTGLILGGGIGVYIIGSETRTYIYDVSEFNTEVDAAFMPQLELLGGYRSKSIALTAGFRPFSKGETEANAEDATDNKIVYDVIRRRPAVFHVDSAIYFKSAELTGSVAYIFSGQASESLNEFSQQKSEDGKERLTGGDQRNSNHMRVAVGGRFYPAKILGLHAGLEYIQASYKKKKYASLEHQNLGGFRVDIGTNVNTARITGIFNVSYQPESSASYQVDDDSQDVTHALATQRPTQDEGDRVKMKQGRFAISAGGGIQF